MHQINWLRSIVRSKELIDKSFHSKFLACWFNDFTIKDGTDAMGVWCMGGEL